MDPDSSPWRWFHSTNWNGGKFGSCTRENCQWTNFWHLPSVQLSLQRDIWCFRLCLLKCHDGNLMAADLEITPKIVQTRRPFSWRPTARVRPKVKRSHGDPSLRTEWQTDMTENITIPQLHWQELTSSWVTTCYLVHTGPLIIEFSFFCITVDFMNIFMDAHCFHSLSDSTGFFSKYSPINYRLSSHPIPP